MTYGTAKRGLGFGACGPGSALEKKKVSWIPGMKAWMLESSRNGFIPWILHFIPGSYFSVDSFD